MKVKKLSKRMKCRKKYKIVKKVAAHNRKIRREYKKKAPGKNKKVKDPGVPNSAPFKDEVLQKFREHQAKMEQEKELKKQLRKERRQMNRDFAKGITTPMDESHSEHDAEENHSEDDAEGSHSEKGDQGETSVDDGGQGQSKEDDEEKIEEEDD